MGKIKVSEATNIQLDWLVAKCEGKGLCILRPDLLAAGLVSPRPYTTDPSQMQPIMERELLATLPYFYSAGYHHPNGLWVWRAYVLGPNNLDDTCEHEGPTPLVAAARCYVASKLGETVEVPEELS
jgi:hypothetical protein